jgi:hypothetical protein
MTESNHPLSELRNQQWPARRNDKTYGKKKAQNAQARAMHFDLFGGGQKENAFVQKTYDNSDVADTQTVEGVEKLTISNLDRETTSTSENQPETILQPSTSATEKDTAFAQDRWESSQLSRVKQPARHSKPATLKKPDLPQRKLRPRGGRKVITRKKLAVGPLPL